MCKEIGRISVVTGGAGGIGGAVAERLLASGHEVVLLDIAEKDLRSFKSSHSLEAQKHLHLYPLDITVPARLKEAFADIEENIGGVYNLVNSAGIVLEKSFMEHSMEDWERVIRVNLIGTFNVCRAAAEGMIKRKEGRIVNLASRLGVCGTPDTIAYSSSKAGVIGFTKALACELAEHNIVVNCLAPGVVISDMSENLRNTIADVKLSQVLIKRFAVPSEAADAVWFLLHQGYFTGQTIHMNGGSYMGC